MDSCTSPGTLVPVSSKQTEIQMGGEFEAGPQKTFAAPGHLSVITATKFQTLFKNEAFN
jgi:hypothetical protein